MHAAAHAFRSALDLKRRLNSERPLWAVELRPPRLVPRQPTRAPSVAGARQHAAPGVEPWIDMYHAVRRLLGRDTLVLTTDDALGDREEEGLRHLSANLGPDTDLSRIVPFLTAKHSLEYCLRFPARALEAGHRASVIVGGDKHDGVPRCLPHAADLRSLLRQHYPGLALGGWANPYREAGWQVELLKQAEPHTDFYLTQVVSHHDLGPLEGFLKEAQRQQLELPALVGVFHYRSAKARTLELLSRFMPVPAEGLRREFHEEGLDADGVCARTILALRGLGVRHVYLCNLSPASAASRLEALKRLT